jgi:hypothetical protein
MTPDARSADPAASAAASDPSAIDILVFRHVNDTYPCRVLTNLRLATVAVCLVPGVRRASRGPCG